MRAARRSPAGSFPFAGADSDKDNGTPLAIELSGSAGDAMDCGDGTSSCGLVLRSRGVPLPLPLPCTECGRPRSRPAKAVTRARRCPPSSLTASSSSSPQSPLSFPSRIDLGPWACRGAAGFDATLPLGASGGDAGDTSHAGRDRPPEYPVCASAPVAGGGKSPSTPLTSDGEWCSAGRSTGELEVEEGDEGTRSG